MRLWTFQNKVAYDGLITHGIWYSNLDYENRLKVVDEQYIKDELETPYGIMDSIPIYCFASMGDIHHTLNLSTMYGIYSHLVGWMRFRLEKMVMIELEVPESFILSSKKHSDMFVEYPGMPKDTPKRKRYEYAKVVREDEIELHNHLEFSRNTRDDFVESLIPYIDTNHIAAIRTFESVDGGNVGYGTCLVKTITIGDHTPLWTDDIYCNGDGYVRVLEDGQLNIINSIDARKYMRKIGMCCAYPYMTLRDIVNSCADFIIEAMSSQIKERGLVYKDVCDITYEELMTLPIKK